MMNEIAIGFGGLVTSLIGFGAKGLADYYWLKSPKLNFKTKPVKGYTDKLDSFVLKFDCSVQIFNYSKNDAYGIEVSDIKFDDHSYKVIFDSIHLSDNPVSDQSTGKFVFTCVKKHDLRNANGSVTVTAEELKFSQSFNFTCIYYNQLGKKYKRTFRNSFKKIEKEKFFTF